MWTLIQKLDGYFAAVKPEGSVKDLKAKKRSRVPPASQKNPDLQLSWWEWAAPFFLRAWTGERTTERCARVLSWVAMRRAGAGSGESSRTDLLVRPPEEFLSCLRCSAASRRDGTEGVGGGGPS